MRAVRLWPWSVRGAVLAWCVVTPTPGLAQESSSPVQPAVLQITAATLREAGPQRPGDLPHQQPPILQAGDEPRRPAALLPLYGSLIALQGMDFHSTRAALDSGSGHEANPAMRHVVNNSAAFLVLKVGATAGVIWASEKMWKKNRKGAVIFAAVVNAAMAAVVANNYGVRR
jgi:hypothetical protein